jgi:hypothetical protein
MIINLRIIALCTLPILVTGAEAIADDAKTYPGAMCQPALPTYEVGRSNNANMVNLNGPTQTWICPIVRDTMAANTGEFVAITVGANTRVECTLETRSDRGLFPKSYDPDNLNPPVIDNTKRFTYKLGEENFEGVEFGFYFIKCLVPQGGFINSYQSEEDD